MKMKKILAGVLAGALTLTSLTLVSFADNEETSSYISVKGNTKWWAMNIDYEQTPIKKGTNTYTLSFTNENTYNDSFGVDGDDKGALEIIFSDLSENLKDITLDSVSVDDEEKTIGGDTTPETKEYYWDGTDSPKVTHVITFTESQLEAIGDINVGSTLKITVSATYDESAVQIGAVNFNISQEKNEEMVKGDSFTLTYDSDSIPEESRYHLKYKIPKIDEPKDDSTDYDYYNIVYNNQLNTDDAENAQAATGLTVTAATEGTKTIYTFTAVAPTSGKRPFAITAEASPKGDWSDTLYLWLGNISIMVVDSDIPATKITLDKTECSLNVGENVTLKETVTPADTTDEVIWESSDEDVATVKDGVVTAVGKGTATITATAGDVSATCEVTVTVPVTKVTLDQDSLFLLKGDTATLTATVEPAEAADEEVTWTSSDEDVATVEDGVVKAVGKGTATITAAAGGKSATCEVSVADPVKTISLYDITVLIGEEKEISYACDPEGEISNIKYTSSDPNVFTVEGEKVKGVGAGTATLTMTAANAGNAKLEATCEVTVTDKAIAATAVTLGDTAIELEVDGTKTLIAKLTPADSTDRIAWTSSDPTVATVDAAGKVTALKVGEATITAKANENASATCKVTVTAKTVAVTSVTLDKETAEVAEGETVQLTATVKPDDATDKTVTWSSSDETVATVDNTGKVTAVKAGEAVITAKAGTKSAECTVTVTAKVSEGEGTVDPDDGLIIEVDDEDITIEADSDTFEETVTVVKAEVSVSEDVAEDKTEAIADAVSDILGGEESTVEVSAVISITLKDQDGNEIQPVNGGVVTITVPYDGKSNYAAYIDGAAPEFIKLAIDEAGAYASFEAKHFSDYYLVALSDEAADAIDKENGENGDNNDDKTEESIWEGTYNAGTDWDWDSRLIIEAAKFANAAAGDTIRIDFTINNEAEYHQIQIKDGENTAPLTSPEGVNEWESIDVTTEGFTFVLNEADTATLKEKGMQLMGYDVTYQSVTLIKVGGGNNNDDKTEESIWEGTYNAGTDWDWDSRLIIEAAKFANAAAGDTIRIDFTINNEAEYHQIQIKDGENTAPLTSPEGVNEWESIDVTTEGFTFVLNEADTATLKEKGMQLMGYDVTYQSVTLIKADNSGTSTTPPVISEPSTSSGNFTVPSTSGGSTSGDTTTDNAQNDPANTGAPDSTEENTATNTTPPAVSTPDGDNDAQDTEGTPVPDDGNGNVGNAGAGSGEDKNAATGVTLALIPVIAAAAGMVISKKRK